MKKLTKGAIKNSADNGTIESLFDSDFYRNYRKRKRFSIIRLLDMQLSGVPKSSKSAFTLGHDVLNELAQIE